MSRHEDDEYDPENDAAPRSRRGGIAAAWFVKYRDKETGSFLMNGPFREHANAVARVKQKTKNGYRDAHIVTRYA